MELTHSFHVAIAEIVGEKKAILLKDMRGWILQNERNKRNERAGYYWTYQSTSALGAKYRYMGESSIGRYLKQLEEDGWLVSHNFNANAYDRTKWYYVNLERYGDGLNGVQWDEEKASGWLLQMAECIAQYEEWKAQNGQTKNQSERPIPSHKTSRKTSPKAQAHPKANPKGEFLMCRRKFGEAYKKKNGVEFVWTDKEGKQLKTLIKNLKEGIKVDGGNVDDIGQLKDYFDGFINGVLTMEDKWYRQNHFSPSGLVSQFGNIQNKLNGKNAEKTKLASLFDSL